MRRSFIYFLAVFLGALSVASVSLAGPLTEAQNKLDQAVGDTGLSPKIETSLGQVIRGALALVGTIFLALTVYAGILWMTAQGKEEQVEKAQSIIRAAVIGLFITMAAYAITGFVTSRLGGVAGGTAPVVKDTCTQAKGICVQSQVGCGDKGVELPGETCTPVNNTNYLCCQKP